MQMSDLIDELAEEAVAEADRRGIDLVNTDTTKQISTMNFLGTFEDRFYEAMQEVIERRRSE